MIFCCCSYSHVKKVYVNYVASIVQKKSVEMTNLFSKRGDDKSKVYFPGTLLATPGQVKNCGTYSPKKCGDEVNLKLCRGWGYFTTK